MSAQVFKWVKAFFKEKFRPTLCITRDKISNGLKPQQGAYL